MGSMEAFNSNRMGNCLLPGYCKDVKSSLNKSDNAMDNCGWGFSFHCWCKLFLLKSLQCQNVLWILVRSKWNYLKALEYICIFQRLNVEFGQTESLLGQSNAICIWHYWHGQHWCVRSVLWVLCEWEKLPGFLHHSHSQGHIQRVFNTSWQEEHK